MVSATAIQAHTVQNPIEIETPPAAKPAANATSTQPRPTAAAKDTVQISSAAQAALKAAAEPQAQTAKQASAGDHQAQTLLAKEQAARKAEA
jgi:hypothetical protein